MFETMLLSAVSSGILLGLNMFLPHDSLYRQFFAQTTLLLNALIPVLLDPSLLILPENPLTQYERIQVFDEILFLEAKWYAYSTITDIYFQKGYSFIIHHVLTFSLIFISYTSNITRGGIIILLLLTSSNPLLELSKIVSAHRRPYYIQGAVYGMFVFVFFTLRVCMFPAILWYYRSYISTTIWTLMQVLYILQLYWLSKLLRIGNKLLKAH
jgi:hypothetical protein